MLRIVRHLLLVLAAALIVLPWFIQALGLPISIASEIALFALVGLGFNLLLGYTGLLSFGHAPSSASPPAPRRCARST